MKKLLTFLFFVLFFKQAAVSVNQIQSLSPDARISMLTASPGPALYSAFGHSAMRVTDPFTGLDEVYNFGTFDFDTPNFYIKFLQGRLLYKLTVGSFNQFFFEYHSEGRGVVEQVLNLNQEEKQRIFEFLQFNRLPENAYYRYDFFFDNCATRIRDIVQNKLTPVWPDDPTPPDMTFRQLLVPYILHIPWIRAGIDLILGLPSDRKATPWEYMYLPDHMYYAFKHASLPDGRPLVVDSEQIIEQVYFPTRTGFLSPGVAGWILFVIGLFLLTKPRIARIFDRFFFSILGIAGIIIAFMWFISEHAPADFNLNLLWTFPAHLYFIFRSDLSKPKVLTQIYFVLVFLIGFCFVAGWLFFPQQLNAAFLPLILYSAIKGGVYGFGRVLPKRIQP
ncbi:MAG TPA: DUF4105 domain-containing protein [Bacteroidales bacterium]|nr:DUF4105 domain-containing protein [Bacteroidales bacterium]